MKLILCGPQHSGKSCLREGLKRALREIEGTPYPYVITANPDGEGAWYQESYQTNPERAKQLKGAYKGTFSPEIVDLFAAWVRQCSLDLVLVDVGGRTTPENLRICSGATDAVILYGDPEALPAWREFCAQARLRVRAEIRSDLNGAGDEVPEPGPDGVWRGSVCGLRRGAPNHDAPTVRRLAALVAAVLRETQDDKGGQTMGTAGVEDGGGAAAFLADVDRAAGAENVDLLRVAFGAPAGNDRIVRDAHERLRQLVESGQLRGGPLLKVNGPMSLPAAMVLAHAVAHLYGAVAMYDPKMHRFVVVAAHGPDHAVGDLLE